MEQKTKDRKKYMKDYLERPEVKERGRKCSREHMRRKRHPPENKIGEVEKIVENMINYPPNFPEEEFNKKLDKILECNPSEIKEKTLKDLIYDILEKEKLLTPKRMMNLYYNPNWANAIEEFMQARNYIKNEDEKYIPL